MTAGRTRLSRDASWSGLETGAGVNDELLLDSGVTVRVRWTSSSREESLGGRVHVMAGRDLSIDLDDEKPAPLRRPLQSVTIEVQGAAGFYMVPGRVLEKEPTDLLHIVLAGEPRRIQRRRFERVGLGNRPCQAVLLDESDQPMMQVGVAVVDLSAGGMRLTCDQALQLGQRLQVSLPLGPGAPIRPIVEVVNVAPAQTGPAAALGASQCTVGVAFRKIEDGELHRVFRFTLEAKMIVARRAARG